MSSKLQNYLRTHRKKIGLSQKEIGLLLGGEDGANISHYERSSRHPTLEAILAYELIFSVPGKDLFAGVSDKVATDMRRRAKALRRKVRKRKRSRKNVQKLAVLDALVSGLDSGSEVQ